MVMDMKVVDATIATVGVKARRLDEFQRQALITDLLDKLGVDVSAHSPWDSNDAPSGKQRADGWELFLGM